MNHSELEKILKNHHREAYLWARQCCGFEDELAKDVLQICYLKILEGKAKLHQVEKVKSWLFSVIRFTAIDELRKKGNWVALQENYDLEDEPPEKEDEFDYQKLLMQLSPMQREVMLMVFYHHLTIAESAEVLQISIGSARTHYDRGKKKLKELIENSQILEHDGK
ncbi:RNA polymerase sigma factor [Algoriphagus marincola]|uniref:RNA polymerase sigma factor n=1 Tax=Algoriphagus marincola TaxID=264027 RepID=A0ABS7N7R5_9BACT|nr:RNA polymerase sigma factor [Algoriphagus marincola]MBY5952030.1 RNA polymerase sigma factor [Algoriphagus marincola]